MKEVKRKHATWKEYKESRTAENHQKYIRQRNKTTQAIGDARYAYESTIVQDIKQEPKRLYKYIRNQQRLKPGIGPLEKETGELAENDEETAELLNEFFQSVFIDESSEKLPDFADRVEPDCVLRTIRITPAVVHDELLKLDTSKAAGPDGIPAVLLRSCADQLAFPLSQLYQKTLVTGKLPQEWKHAKITPIFKKGSRRKPGNYRPISLTSQPCKVLERIVRKHIIEHLEACDLISNNQHGFVRQRSCQTNLLEALEDWTRLVDEGNALDIVYLDFQKAFDTVPHKRLAKKLNAYGIRGQVLKCVCDFLSDRSQQVAIGSSLSSMKRVTSGVPQGSVLGPTLFVLCVNELPSLVNSNMLMFADDAKLFRKIQDDTDVQNLQEDIDMLENWSREWLLKFNVAKCKTMHCGTSNTRHEYHMKQAGNVKILGETTLERDLGVNISNTLKATHHCQLAANKAMSSLRLLRTTFSRLTPSNFSVLYTTYVRPHLDYCLSAIGPFMVQDFKALEKVQRRATKLVHGLRLLPYDERLKILKVPSMESRVQRGDLIETFKILTGKVAVDADRFFEKNQDERTRGHQLKLKKRSSRSQLRAKFFANRVVTPWNNLPEEVVSATSTNSFKMRLDRHQATVS